MEIFASERMMKCGSALEVIMLRSVDTYWLT